MTRSHSLVVHWDGKFIPDLIGRSVSDRIAILVSYDGTSKFLGSPMIKPSTGANIADAVYKKLVEWKIADRVTAMDHNVFESGLKDETVRSYICDVECNEITIFCHQQLIKSHCRKDYDEFLELVLTFLGAENFNFRAPGGTSNARWMAKASYSLKIFIFRQQFSLTARELNGLRDVCMFLVRIYVKAWFMSTNAIAAPRVDLEFIKSTVEYAKIDHDISKIVLNKMKNHLWYLAERTVALAFFDSNVTYDEKRKMVEHLKLKEPVVK